MSEIVITPLTADFLIQVREIFFESSTKKDFKDQSEKEMFAWKYLGFYLSRYPQYAWVALEKGMVLGYVLGMPMTQDQDLYALQPHLQAFEEHFKAYPAHLHINCHKDARGKGIGRMLVKQLIQQLQNEKVPGLHIMTGPNSDNRYFYQKLGFVYEKIINEILFSGIRI